ncbi:sulfotransferase family protein [Paracoccus sp. TK19116]|uniref:Sulfotransferase family protein n=1 Tax=Paracoccus albicereus TaxID=2922394 RepID=A0ABT1MU82_9RHOB|nr:sulfotransferase family 2 domain-containing protein [Paracoccus albicereus]MCQ0971239.1 sulfotransferase family protein [Paracoccus albicereus]
MPFVELEDKRRLLFIHVPKTGGTSVEGWMRTLAPLRFHEVQIPKAMKCTPQHLRMSDFNILFGRGYFDHAFMIVRNPYDRIASEYRMRAAIHAASFVRMWPSFSHWLEAQLDQMAGNRWILDNHLRPQWEFHGGRVEVFRLEDGLDTALATVAGRLGLPAPESVPHDLKTGGGDVTVEWDLSDRLRVEEVYARDFAEFGYEKRR